MNVFDAPIQWTPEGDEWVEFAWRDPGPHRSQWQDPDYVFVDFAPQCEPTINPNWSQAITVRFPT